MYGAAQSDPPKIPKSSHTKPAQLKQRERTDMRSTIYRCSFNEHDIGMTKNIQRKRVLNLNI